MANSYSYDEWLKNRNTGSSQNASLSALPKPTGGYQNGTYTPTDYSGAYDSIHKSGLHSLYADYKANEDKLNAQIPKIAQEYDKQRSRAYANARITALGNNERLAAKGLAGNAYTTPTTGYSESSRIADDNALRNALNYANMQQQGAEDDIRSRINDLALQRDKGAADLYTQLAHALMGTQQSENQFAANYGQNQSQFDQNYALQKLQMEEATRQFNEQMAAQAAQNAYSQAMQEVSAFGKVVTKAAAEALGVPVGTTLASLSAKKSSGGSRGGGTPQVKDENQNNTLNPLSTMFGYVAAVAQAAAPLAQKQKEEADAALTHSARMAANPEYAKKYNSDKYDEYKWNRPW